MNNVFTAKLLQNLRNKKGEKGFTLIELLVVVIIIGVLAAVALPNLLGQVGKARESEAKNIIGALNRAQQSRFVERGSFVDEVMTIDTLEVPTGAAKYYGFDVPDAALQRAVGNDNGNQGTRDYVGAVLYDQDTRDFQTVVCRSMNATGVANVPYSLAALADAQGVILNSNAATNAIVAADGDPTNTPALGCNTAAGNSQSEEVL